MVVEWLDDPFVAKLQLREDFGYEDRAGKLWLARQGQVLDGASIPPAFRDMIGMPFVGDYRRTSVVYDYYCHVMSEPWRDVHRMFYDASLTEGVSEVNAKVMYAALYAAGLRWEMPGSSCFRSCHAAAPSLTWKPQVEERDVETRGRMDQADEPCLGGDRQTRRCGVEETRPARVCAGRS